MPKKQSAKKEPPPQYVNAPKKVLAAVMKLGEEVVTEMEGLSTDEIKGKIAGLAIYDAECQVFLSTNEKVLELKEELALVEGPTKDTRADIANRRAVLVHLLVEKGGVSADEGAADE